MNDEFGGESETPWMSLKIFSKKNPVGLSLETQLQPFPRKTPKFCRIRQTVAKHGGGEAPEKVCESLPRLRCV